MGISLIINDLVGKSWSVIPNFFSTALVQALHDELQLHVRRDELHPAKVGSHINETLRRDIRGDDILRLDGSTENQTYYLDIMNSLKLALNRSLFLGLDTFETHFAIYPPGAGYQKHVDSFRNNNFRRITVVSYLNSHWQPQNGGELLLFDTNDDVIASVAPIAGTLACFVSQAIPHEVSTTYATRYSIAGWFRIREPI